MSDSIGRLVKTTSIICQYCGRGHALQLRAVKVVITIKGEDTLEERKFLLCPNCGDQEPYVDKKENKNKHRELKVEEVREVRNGDKKRHSIKSRTDKTPKRSY